MTDTDPDPAESGGDTSDAPPEPEGEEKPDKGAADDRKPQDEGQDKEKDKEKAEEEENVRSAQDRAADPESAQQWGLFASRMDTAFQAMFGVGASGFAAAGGTANFFLGDTAVGQVGDQNFAGRRRSLEIRVRSGLVAKDVLAQIDEAYVEPDDYRELTRKLEQHQLLFIKARGGTGRTMTALHLLHRSCHEGVRKLDPDARLKSLQPKEFEPGHGYLLESLDPDQAATLKAFHAERLGQYMRDRGCMMVVIVDESTRLPMHEIGDLVSTGFTRVKPDRLLERYVEWGLVGSAPEADHEVLSRPEVKEIIAQLTEEVPARELAKLGDLLIEVAHDRIGFETVRNRYSAAGKAGFGEWFDAQADLEQRAFVIALAVFNDEPVQLVSTAATMLADRFKKLAIPRRGDRSRDVFAVSLTQRVQQARAELANGSQETEFGDVPVTKARFQDERYPQLVLDHVRTQYTQALDVVLDWLLALGSIPNPQVYIRAGVAAGLLSQYDFVNVYRRIINPWAVFGDADQRWAAVAALQVPARLPDYGLQISKLLRHWSRHTLPQLRSAAAQALGTTTSISPEAALKQLRYLARHADWVIAYRVGEAISDLFVRADPGLVLRTLVRWSRDDEFVERRLTALLAVLITSHYVEIQADGSERWPALVWFAEHRPDLRRHIVLLFARLLVTIDFKRRTYVHMKQWVRITRREPAVTRPLARLLRDIGARSGETASIRTHLADWAEDPDGPVTAARTVLEHFDQEEGPQ
ncbi:hypothetical protein SAMN04489727_2731 [Amycolatopsis tolypomycina]|uniref:Uncharacterized protein n=1 Tax=Amycolatopsis tolypomycina TaxID=208445 RepID=A0A1H4Q4N8_9PSEU|nr:hypothetical protein [Amycolatopsis tolypomycina]SEC14585.1 hypothetical protein SAMN04489727_2731 [Amycolatopsis tolypomycina]